MNAQASRAERFRDLHTRPHLFVVPNPWDAGSARILATLGFEALATTSAGFAFSLGRPDAQRALGRDDVLANARDIAAATELPVSADLENGFGDDPDDCAETIRRAAQAGVVGGSIEEPMPARMFCMRRDSPRARRSPRWSTRSRRGR